MKDELKLLGLGLVFAIINVLLIAALYFYLAPKMGYFGWVVAAIFSPFAG
jgi:hypothetical protein